MTAECEEDERHEFVEKSPYHCPVCEIPLSEVGPCRIERCPEHNMVEVNIAFFDERDRYFYTSKMGLSKEFTLEGQQ